MSVLVAVIHFRVGFPPQISVLVMTGFCKFLLCLLAMGAQALPTKRTLSQNFQPARTLRLSGGSPLSKNTAFKVAAGIIAVQVPFPLLRHCHSHLC
jgi:hypothetical protein